MELYKRKDGRSSWWQLDYDRLAELAGPPDDASRGIRDRVRKMMCPCLDNKDCLWPRCGNIGDGLGHYP